jgi:hypothetical protein
LKGGENSFSKLIDVFSSLVKHNKINALGMDDKPTPLNQEKKNDEDYSNKDGVKCRDS